MKKEQTSKRGGYEDILCPFTDMYITQGSGYTDGTYSHKGTRAIDVRGAEAGVRYAYYAPVTLKAVKVIASGGETTWQSVNKVRFADGDIDYVTVETVHDDTRNSYVGMVVKQGEQLGNMGKKGNATGVHCHIEFAKGKQGLVKNKYGVWGLSNSVEFEDACFMDNTNVIRGVANWKYLKDIPVHDDEYINIPPTIEERNIYKKDTKQQFATIKPKKFGGLTYKIYSLDGEYAEIETVNFGRCYVKATDMTPITKNPQYQNGNY